MAYIGNSPANVGNYQVVDNITTFNGTLTSFALTANSQAITPAKSGQLLVSLNGVLQEPDDTGTDGFKVSGSNIVFSSAPASGSTFWCVYQGQNVDIGTPSDGTVGTDQMSYPLANFTSTGIDDNATSTAITIGSDEQVTISNSNSADNTLTIEALNDNGNEANVKLAGDISGPGMGSGEVAGSIQYFNNTDHIASISGMRDGGDEGQLSFKTRDTSDAAPVERMRIDSAGRVTMPNQPSCAVSNSAGATIGYITGGTEAFDIGNIYDGTTGRFTVPVGGLYAVGGTFYTLSSSTMEIFVRVNGSNRAYLNNVTTNLSAFGYSLNTLIQVNAGDYIQFYNNKGGVRASVNEFRYVHLVS